MNRPEPLTPEERELARLLGRPGTSAPSARVDEAVLAAARAAVGAATPVAAAETSPSPRAARVPRRRTRLPAVLGVAASVVFAVGIAWQLKFDDPTTTSAPPLAVEVAADTAAPAAAPAAPAAARAAAESPAEAPAVTEPVPIPKPSPTPAEPPAPVKRLAPAPAAPAPVAAPAPTEELTLGTYSAAPPIPVPPAPAQAQAETAAAPRGEERATLDAIQVTGSTIETPRDRSALRSQRAAPAAPARNEMPAPAAAMAAPADFGGRPESSAITTAVDADALLPRRQWIERIRERRDAGDLDTARASLRRYLQHYPEVRVPRDLRALLDS